MLKLRTLRNRLILSAGSGLCGFSLGSLANFISLHLTLAVLSLGLLLMLFALLDDGGVQKKGIMAVATIGLMGLTLGIPYHLSVERTIYIADQHAQHWGRPDLDVLEFPNKKTHTVKFGDGHKLFTPVVGHRADKKVIPPSELVVDIDSRIQVKRPTLWQPLDPIEGYQRFWYGMTESIPYKFPKGPNEMMELTFPEPGEYEFQWHLRAGDISPVNRSFKIKLVKD